MNVFEDLIGSLKDDNLLEETVLQTKKAGSDDEFLGDVENGTDFLKDISSYKSAKNTEKPPEDDFSDLQTSTISQNPAEFAAPVNFSTKNSNGQPAEPEEITLTASPAPDYLQTTGKPALNEKDFYRKRAIEEVSGLQMVEHILSGVEREQNKVATKLYNDIAVKKALHDFLQILEDAKSPEHAQAEFQLMQETETWCSALSHRDKRISVAHLRRYCETTKPPLSSQALISLARFYRNLPYSESARSKFDLVVTRLFSKDLGGEKRILAFSRNDLIQHLAELYADWSSIPLYSAEDDDSQIVLTALKFEDLMAEAERADTFDELINTDFFNRLRLLKESSGDVFYAPLVTATTVESNIRIGNKYVDLINLEREKSSVGNLQDKYGFMHDQAISDSTSKTLQLVELLKEQSVEEKIIETSHRTKPASAKPPEKSSAIVREDKKEPKREVGKEHKKEHKTETKSSLAKDPYIDDKPQLKISKTLLVAGILGVILSIGLFIWYNGSSSDAKSATSAKKVNLENSSLQQYLQTARIAENTFHAVTLPSWDILSREKKEELLKKIQLSGIDKGYAKVELVNKEGKVVGSATAAKVEVITP